MVELLSTAEAKKSFYPTPAELASKLVSDIRWTEIREVLEPSAGTGNLIDAMIRDIGLGGNINKVNVSAIEIDPNLRSVLMGRFGEAAENAAYDRKEELRNAMISKRYSGEAVTPAEEIAYNEACGFHSAMQETNVRIVHDNFLTYDSAASYDLILMNPPFDCGDAHLLKAIRLQERYGGRIRCILNAETIRNPYSALRRLLAAELQKYAARITFEKGAFEDAERATDVEVAIIRLDIPRPVRESDIFSRMKKAEEEKAYHSEATDLVVNDAVQQILTNYRVEVESGCELIRQYIDLMPYIQTNIGSGKVPILELTVRGKNATSNTVNEYVKAVRKKYWSTLFQNPEFVGQLTSNLQNELYSRVNEMVAYDFTEFNIRTVMAEMNARMQDGIKDTIIALFDKMTSAHSWYPEASANVHYYNGWATNKAHRINPKVILPANGVFSTYSWEKDAFSVRKAKELLADVEKVFNYLDGNMTCPVDIDAALNEAARSGSTKNIQLKFFDVTFYKKGTMHLKFRDQILLDRFNIYCSQNKNWLPPAYGRKKYAEMSEDERVVIDAFNGNGEKGSAQERYDSIVTHAGYYLAPPTTQTAMLTAGSSK
jgi:hypothetical protein